MTTQIEVLSKELQENTVTLIQNTEFNKPIIRPGISRIGDPTKPEDIVSLSRNMCRFAP